MRVLIFDLRGPLAHFRRPDTLGAHVTYPVIPRTALRGLIGAILGLQELSGENLCGVQIRSPIRTVSQELSLHGKTWTSGQGAAASFHRPTSVELVVNPRYRVFYAGDLLAPLAERIRNRQSCYHTYLGSAFCLTFPEFVAQVRAEPLQLEEDRELTVDSVVPASVVKRLEIEQGCEYARVGGIMYEHIGGRRFRGMTHWIYESNGRPVRFRARRCDQPIRFARLIDPPVTDRTVCLW